MKWNLQRSGAFWLSLALTSAAPLLMAPGSNGCPSCNEREPPVRATLAAGQSLSQVYRVPGSEARFVEVTVTQGAASVEVIPASDGVTPEDIRCRSQGDHTYCEIAPAGSGSVEVIITASRWGTKVVLESGLFD